MLTTSNQRHNVKAISREQCISILSWIAWILVAFYAFCMIVWPWHSSGFHWQSVQAVWDRWQSLNVGVLALVSSLIAFNIARYKADRQRKQEFQAAKAFLPHAFSELTKYAKECAAYLLKCWRAPTSDGSVTAPPNPPVDYKEVFRDCIKYADPPVASYIAGILVRLQIHEARMVQLYASHQKDSDISPNKLNLIYYFYRISELNAFVGKNFDYARGLAEFDSSRLSWDELNNSYGVLNIWLDEIRVDGVNLEGISKKRLSKWTINGF